ncbi:MAG: C40 family peptidase [Bernardetiaceae bacterium]|nr:C40 family peptidase [Bernardetiaceae bacterium]
MNGIDFVRDEQGKTTKAVIDLTQHRELFERIFNEYMQAQYAEPTPKNKKQAQGIALELIDEARQYIGTPYKGGGTDNRGMDCSGFTQTTFAALGIPIPRSSRDQAQIGRHVPIEEVVPGDLVFFVTGSDPNRISHVGIITESGDTLDDLTFIHASTSRGVVEEPLFRYDYWKRAFRHARRIELMA